MLSLKLLRFLEEVAKAGSMRKAATRLNISSSAINRQILALEEELGTPLFERLPRRLRLTASGEIVIAYAQTTAKEHQRFLGRIAAMKGMQRGEIRIATMGGLVNGPLLRLVNSFVEQHSRVLMRIEMLSSGDAIVNRLLSGESDIGLGYNLLPNPALRVMQSLNVEIGVVVAPGHPLASQRPLKLSHCMDHPLVTGSVGMVIRGVVDHAFTLADLPLQPTVETDSIEVMKQFAIAGTCYTFLNPMDISAEMQRGELICLPIKERHFPSPNLKLVVRAKGTLESAAMRLAEEVKARMIELSTTDQGIPGA